MFTHHRKLTVGMLEAKCYQKLPSLVSLGSQYDADAVDSLTLGDVGHHLSLSKKLSKSFPFYYTVRLSQFTS